MPNQQDIARIHAHLAQDPLMAEVLAATSIEWPQAKPDIYAALLRAIVYQQLSGKAAATIHGRFLALFEDGYPHPQPLLGLPVETLRGAGLSYQKAGYLQHIAEFFIREERVLADWRSMPDEDLIQYLTQIKGVGRWTVEMLLMFTLDRPDVLPLDDLGIQQAMVLRYGITEKGRLLKQRMTEIARPWQPYRTYASMYLWRWKDSGAEVPRQSSPTP